MSTPSWFEGLKETRYARLAEDRAVDVVVIGGGIAGVSTAYQLARAGKRVALVEQKHIGNGDTGNTSAFLTYVTDESLTKLTKTVGEECAKISWEAGRGAIEEIERVVNEEGIKCDFRRCSAVQFAADEKGKKQLEEDAALARGMGFPLALTDGPFPKTQGMEIPHQALFHPMKYLVGLAKCARDLGVDIYENTHVHDIETPKNGVIVVTDGGRISATNVVVATHAPVTPPYQFPIRMEGKRTYLIEVELPHGHLPEGLYWDTENPYHYLRVDAGAKKDRLLMGGEDHATGQSAIPETEHFSRLRSYLRRMLPDVSWHEKNRWSGQVYESSDGLPFIGPAAGQEHVYVATGFAGNGMTFGVASGLILSGLITEGSHPWAEAFRATRVHGVGNMLGMNWSVTRAWFGGMKADVDSIDQIPPGTGAVMREDGKPVAVFKAKNGRVLKLSAVCTHLKCTVNWNGAEESWDCPCHGSRFDKEGQVLNGPAIKPLERLDGKAGE